MPMWEKTFTSRHDPEGYFLGASPECIHVTGYRPDELIGMSVYDLCHPEDVVPTLEGHRALLENAAARGKSSGFNMRLRRKDGTYVWLEVEIRLERDAATGLVTGLEANSTDVGHRFSAARAASSRLAGRAARDPAGRIE
ncbi:MAG: PAS domain-containing protein [Actinomycetota bacterium]